METLSILGGAASGFFFRYLAERAKERNELFQMMIKKQEANEKAADAATQRVSVEAGKWVRRFIVVSAVFATILAPFLISFFGIPIVISIQGENPSFLGVIGGGTYTKFVEITGFFLTPEVRQTLLTVVGFYFGNAVAASSSR